MQDFDMNFVSKVYTLDYFLSYKPAADGVHIITWKSNYYNSSAIWTVKQEVVKTGAKIVPPTGVQMPNHEGEMYVSGWSPAVPETMPNQHLVFTAVWASGSGPVQPSTTCEISWWIYDRENDKRWYIGVENKYKYQEYGDVLKFPPHKSSSYLFLGWYDDNGETVYVPSQDKKEYGGAAGNWNTDYGKLSGYSRVYYMIPEIDASGITGNTTKYYMRYYYNGSVIDDSLAGTPSKINVGSDSYAFKYWISHETYAPTDGSDVIINAKYEKETYSGEATVNVYCRFLYYDGSSSSPTVLQDYTLLYTAKTSSTNDLKKIRIETPMHWELVTSNDNVWTTTDDSWWDGKIYSSSVDIRCTFRTYVENMPVPRAIQWDDWNIGYNWRTSGQNVNAGKKATFIYRIDGQVAFTYQADIASNLSYIPGTEEIQKYFKQQGISSSDKLESWTYTFGDQTHKLPDGYFVMYDSLTLDAVMQKPGHYMFYAKRFDTDDAPELISELWSSKDLNVYNEYFSYPRKKHTNGSIADPTSLVVTEWIGSYGKGQGQFFKGEHEVYYYYGIRKNVQPTTIPYLAKINLYGPQIRYTPSNQATVINENVDSFIGTYYGTVGETTPPAVSISSFNLPLYGYNNFVYYSEEKSIATNTLSINLKNGYFTLATNKTQKIEFNLLAKTGGSTRWLGRYDIQVGLMLDIYKFLSVEKKAISVSDASNYKKTHVIKACAYGPKQKQYWIEIPQMYVVEDWSWMYQWSPMNKVVFWIEPSAN